MYVKKVNSILFSIILSSSLFSCFSYKTDEEIEKEHINTIINVINKRDVNELNDLFIYVVQILDNFDSQLNEFYSFCFSNIAGYRDRTYVAIKDKEGDYESKFQRMSFTLIGDIENYQLCILWCIDWTPDEKDYSHIGIWSLYIIKESQNPEPEYNYWGDGKWTLGINIGIISSDDVN